MTGRLFYEDEFDAIRTMIAESGKTIKQCALFLYPDMKPDSAYTKLKTQLNEKGDEELKFRQVIALMKYCERYDPLMYQCDETLHARPDRKAPEDEKIKIVETIRGATEAMNTALKRLNALEQREVELKLASSR